MHNITFWTWIIHIESIEHDCTYKDLKVSGLQAYARLEQLDKYWTLDPVIIRLSPTDGNFLCCCKVLGFVLSEISDSFVLMRKTRVESSETSQQIESFRIDSKFYIYFNSY